MRKNLLALLIILSFSGCGEEMGKDDRSSQSAVPNQSVPVAEPSVEPKPEPKSYDDLTVRQFPLMGKELRYAKSFDLLPAAIVYEGNLYVEPDKKDRFIYVYRIETGEESSAVLNTELVEEGRIQLPMSRWVEQFLVTRGGALLANDYGAFHEIVDGEIVHSYGGRFLLGLNGSGGSGFGMTSGQLFTVSFDGTDFQRGEVIAVTEEIPEELRLEKVRSLYVGKEHLFAIGSDYILGLSHAGEPLFKVPHKFFTIGGIVEYGDRYLALDTSKNDIIEFDNEGEVLGNFSVLQLIFNDCDQEKWGLPYPRHLSVDEQGRLFVVFLQKDKQADQDVIRLAQVIGL